MGNAEKSIENTQISSKVCDIDEGLEKIDGKRPEIWKKNG